MKPALNFSVLGGFLMLALTSSAKAQVPQEILDFRNSFMSLSAAKGIDAKSLNELIYLPDANLLSAPNASNAQDFLSDISNRLRSDDPFNLYQNGSNTRPELKPEAAVVAPLKALGDSINDRLTIVVVPGVFGEFIKTHAFEDVFSKSNTAYLEYFKLRLGQVKAQGSQAVNDHHYSLDKLGQQDARLEDLVKVASIDSADGKPLVNLVIFETPLASLESMGDITEKAAIFSRRLNKFFEIMGTPKNLAFLGYSRGTPVGLEMLARAHENEQANPWIKNVKAMVSLGGVVYGSDLADQAENMNKESPAPAQTQQLALLTELLDTLENIKGGYWPESFIIARNTERWVKFLKGMVKISAPDLIAQVKSMKITDLAKKDVQQKIMDKFKVYTALDVTSTLHVVIDIGFKNFQSAHPLKEYDQNVERLREVIRQAKAAAYGLSTEARLAWWAKNIVPTDGIKYYSVAGTMVNDEEAQSTDLAHNKASFNFGLLDDNSLVGNYHAFLKYSGMSVNDSQVAAYKVRFWPELNHLLNPAQPAMDDHFLGVVGTHHWGLALRVVNEDRVPQFNPFPRDALLLAIGSTIAAPLAPEAPVATVLSTQKKTKRTH